MRNPVDQVIAEFFRARLERVLKGSGYHFDFLPERIFVDGRAPSEASPVSPLVEYIDDDGQLEQVGRGDAQGVVSFQPAVMVTVRAKESDYKRIGREVMSDVFRACEFRRFDDDAPPGVIGIDPSSWAREQQEGAFLRVQILFTVKADSSAEAG